MPGNTEIQKSVEDGGEKPKKTAGESPVPDWKKKGSDLIQTAGKDIEDVAHFIPDLKETALNNEAFKKTGEFLAKNKIEMGNLVDYLKTQFLDPTIANPSNVEIVQAVKDWQEARGLKPDGVIGPKTFAKIQEYPDLIAQLKTEKPVWARAAEGNDAPEARRYEVLIPKGTEYEFQSPDKQIVKGKFTDENTPAILLTETDKTYKVQLSDGSTVRIPKSPEVELARTDYKDPFKENSQKKSSSAAAPTETEPDAFDAMDKLETTKKSFRGPKK